MCFGVYKNAGSSKSNTMSDKGVSAFEITLDSFKVYDSTYYEYSSIFSVVDIS